MRSFPSASGPRAWGAGVVVCVAAVGGLVAWVCLSAAAAALRGRMGDFSHFYYAAEAVRAGGDIYASHTRGYIYPPLFAVMLAPLSWLRLEAAAVAWAGLNGAFLVAAVWIGAREMLARAGGPLEPWRVGAVALVGLLLAGDKARSSINQGQTDLLVTLCILLALVWLKRRPIACGGALGLAANIKYVALLFVPYLLVRGKWRAAGATLAWTAVLALAPALAIGWEANARGLATALGGMARMVGAGGDGPAAAISAVNWPRSVSITSAVAKARGESGLSAATIGIVAAVAGMCVLVAWRLYGRAGLAFWTRRSEGPAGAGAESRGGLLDALEWSGVIVAVLVFGPQTDGRHLVLLLPVHLLGAAMLLSPRRGVPWWPLVAAGVLMQVGLNFPPAGLGPDAWLEWWRSVGGASWCVLVGYFVVLWTGLRRISVDRRPAAPARPASGAGAAPAAESLPMGVGRQGVS